MNHIPIRIMSIAPHFSRSSTLIRALFLVGCLSFIGLSANGQGLSVFVKDAQTQEPLMGAYLVNEDGSYIIITDEEGRSILRGVPLDEVLEVSYTGYRSRRLTLRELLNDKGIVQLEQIAIGLSTADIVVSSKAAERQGDIANQVSVIDAKQIELLNPQTTADLLEASGVFVQRSQMGGGSPVIRGFEANKLLIVIDGVRLNNAIYRNGHLQNVITIDNAILERTEVVQGPSSVIYGSDALGGVMHFITRDPKLALRAGEEELFEGSAYGRYSSANSERTVHLDFNYGTRKLGALTSLTYSDFGDVRVGNRGWDNYPGFGRKDFYVATFTQPDGSRRDSTLTNPNPLIMRSTGYQQFDLLQKIKYQFNNRLSAIINFQYSTTSNIPRFDALAEYSIVAGDTPAQNDTIPRFAQWDYGPQNRFFLSAKARYLPANDKFFTEANLIASYQKVDEDRISRRYRRDTRQHQYEDVHVGALNLDVVKVFNKKTNNKLLYGAELIYNKVFSTAFNENVQTGVIDTRFALTRYPNGGSDMATGALYLNYRRTFGDKVNFMAGTRYTYAWLSSDFRIDTLVLPLPFDNIQLSSGGLTGSVSTSYNFLEGWYLDAVASSALRSPNVDDYGKVRANGGYVTFPNDSLGSEKSLNFEVSLTKEIDRTFLVSATYYYTYLFDAIVRDYFTFDGERTYFIDGRFDTIQANVNTGRAYIQGLSGSLQWNPIRNVQVRSSLNWAQGLDITGGHPLAHIPPLYGQTSITYETNKLEIRLLSRYNGWKRLEDYAPLGSSDNLDLATPDGTPPWATLNLYIKYVVNPQLTLNVAAENITDQHYRHFSSGVSAPGRNFILTLRSRF